MNISKTFDMMLRWTMATSLVAVVIMGSGRATTQEEFAISRYDKVPGGAYAVVAEVRAKPGKENELRAATLPLVAKVRREPNNLLYFLHEDRQTPGHFIFYEIFASLADFEAHNATPHVQSWFAKLPELADGGVKVIRMEILGNKTAPPR
jgi:quinol monooxygenase YgiN